MDGPPNPSPPHRRRILLWAAAALVAAAVVAGAFLAVRDGDGGGSSPCAVVVKATEEVDRGDRTPASLLEVVREQAPVARAEAERDESLRPVADAIEAMQADLETGRLPRSFIALHERCG